MTLLDLLTRLAVGAPGLIRLLEKVAAEAPDLAPDAQLWINKLNAAVSADNLVALAASLPQEIADILQGKINKRNHPSDAA